MTNAARGLLIQLTGVGFQSADAVALMEQSYGVHFPVMPEATTKGYFESWHTEVGGTFTVLENLGKGVFTPNFEGEVKLIFE